MIEMNCEHNNERDVVAEDPNGYFIDVIVFGEEGDAPTPTAIMEGWCPDCGAIKTKDGSWVVPFRWG